MNNGSLSLATTSVRDVSNDLLCSDKVSVVNANLVREVSNTLVLDCSPACSAVKEDDTNSNFVSLATDNARSDALFQLNEIVTPIKVDRLAHWLEGYDSVETKFLLGGFSSGFSISCQELPTLVNSVTNQKPAREKPEVLEKLLKKELDNNRIAGPYPEIPFVYLCIWAM